MKQNQTVKKQELIPEHEQLLHDQVIEERHPGPIVRDFDALLTYIDTHHPDVTPKQRLLSLSALSEVNERLTHPLDLGLKRPVQKSYPPIHGLYLLARVSGLVRVAGDTLLLDEEVVQSWTDLNPTERYFTLLETWLIRGMAEIIGERGFGTAWESFKRWQYFARSIPAEGRPIAGTDAEQLIRYSPGWHNLGLLGLFGLMRIHDVPSEPGEGWHIERIERTPFGDAMFNLLSIEFFSDWDNLPTLENERPISYGVLQPVIKPYFPEWEKNLQLPEDEFQTGVYVFKVSLGRIWRRIAVPAEMDLDSLANTILDTVAFDRDHLYNFTYRNRFGTPVDVNHPYMEEGASTDDVLVGDLPLSAGQRMTFLYDFGDCWEFDVKLERIEAVDAFPLLGGAVVLEKHGQAPDQYRDWW